jgi:hypothetical protein
MKGIFKNLYHCYFAGNKRITAMNGVFIWELIKGTQISFTDKEGFLFHFYQARQNEKDWRYLMSLFPL